MGRGSGSGDVWVGKVGTCTGQACGMQGKRMGKLQACEHRGAGLGQFKTMHDRGGRQYLGMA